MYYNLKSYVHIFVKFLTNFVKNLNLNPLSKIISNYRHVNNRFKSFQLKKLIRNY